ncbi:transcription antiterminator [Alkalibacterium putridalgicola]|uniref:BglG family transcription antiterminator n=1 Tax=Alkalibacterium putridalgicola TaxID=426703 RepID=UPI0034CF4A7B
MSLISKRKKTLILYLSNKKDFVTAKDLSQVLDTSEKTIYRLVKQLNDESTDGLLIKSERGRGYKLDYKKYIEGGYIKETPKMNISPIERRNNVIEELLFISPVAKNISEIYEKYYVSDTVISSDEKIIANNFKRYNLKLERHNQMIKVLGKEEDIRKAIKELVQDNKIGNMDALHLAPDSEFNRYDAQFIFSQIKTIESKMNITLPYPYNVNIFSHLYIVLSRFRKVGTKLYRKSQQLSVKDREAAKENPEIFVMAEKIINNINRYLQAELPEMEVYYLYQYLVSSRMQKETSEDETIDEEVESITNFYIDEMMFRLGVNIDRTALFHSLAKHIKPMINRLNHGISMKNNLLEQIKLEYTEIFNKVSEVSVLVSKNFHLPDINEDETGFLTLYFAQIIERFPHKVKTLIMCTTGVGTSELLRVKVERKFPEVEVVDVVSTQNINEILQSQTDIDLVISTIRTSDYIKVPHLLVSAMFTLDDQERLADMIEGIRYDKKSIV